MYIVINRWRFVLGISAINGISVKRNENGQQFEKRTSFAGGEGDICEISTKNNKNKKNEKTGRFNAFVNKILKYNPECSDGKDDGKLSFKEAAGSFLRGCLNTLTNVVDSVVEHPVATVLSVAVAAVGTMALTSAGIVSAPVIAIAGAAIGIGIGGVKIGKGIYNAAKADSDKDAKKAFENMGEGTSAIAISALSMKKGVSDLKEMKQLAASAQDMAKTASHYADDAAETLSRAESSFENAAQSAKKISSNSKEGSKTFSKTVELADEAGSRKFNNEINKAKASAEKISQIDDFSQQTLTEAKQSLESVKKSAAEAAKSADDANLYAQKTAKAATLKQAKVNHEMTSVSRQNAETAAENTSVNARILETKAENLADLVPVTESEIKNIGKSFISIDEAVTGTDYTFSEYTDDGVFGYDGSGRSIRDDMRTRIEMKSSMSDDKLQVVNLDEGVTEQLSSGSKYAELGQVRTNRQGNKVFVCENLKDAPDFNGLRGKTPLSGKQKAVNWRLKQVKKSGIGTIIDLRAEGECSTAAKNALQENGLRYVNFPVEDSKWTQASLSKITEYISAVNDGDFYVGCANGESRTDLAIAINYILNPKAKNLPNLYYGTASTSRVSIKANINQILDLVKANSDIVKEWGWKDYAEFISETGERTKNILTNLN